ncbi:heavy metal-binding protein HIP-like [Crassostrea angulata]|uniref:heavy metal-binding protein HIP-like n=1 Tax=Magallana angulata TaxID=2784310 RepID=UPI0022B20D9A|nr:heavy metal-binding protein HIP-like [Crassostrea angulata]
MSSLFVSKFDKLYGAGLFFLLLLGVSGIDDFIANYDKYHSVCKKMVYQCEEKGVIAFHARLSTNLRNLKDKDVVVFGTVTLNTGKGYNPTTGKFTAPSRGHYSFTWTIATNAGYYFCTQLVINGKPVSYNHVNGKTGGNNYETGSSTVILKMEKNDVVSILLYDAGEFARGDWSSFSGFKL